MAVGNGGTVLTSPDKVTWTQQTSATFDNLTDIVWNSSQYVAVGTSLFADSPILTSPDGVTWTLQTSGTTNDLNGITWDGGQFVAVGLVGEILTSPDGIVWTSQNLGQHRTSE